MAESQPRQARRALRVRFLDHSIYHCAFEELVHLSDPYEVLSLWQLSFRTLFYLGPTRCNACRVFPWVILFGTLNAWYLCGAVARNTRVGARGVSFIPPLVG